MSEERKKPLCFTCLYRDSRPEVGVIGGRLIYCMRKDRVVSPKFTCELYSRATEKAKEQLRKSLYGVYEEDEEG
ncbi:MAG: hypothetical protein QW520_01575 [Methanomassiliicoccales archaeon]